MALVWAVLFSPSLLNGHLTSSDDVFQAMLYRDDSLPVANLPAPAAPGVSDRPLASHGCWVWFSDARLFLPQLVLPSGRKGKHFLFTCVISQKGDGNQMVTRIPTVPDFRALSVFPFGA